MNNIDVMKQALEHVQEFKRRWWAVPPFGNKVNKATREAVSAAHSPIFRIEDTLRTAIEVAEKQEPVGYFSVNDYGNWEQNESGHGEPLYTTPPAPMPDPLHLSRILHELAGAASMCWTPAPTGVFDSQEAIKHVTAAIEEIRARSTT